MRICRSLLRGAALLVPGRQRAEWFAEWRSELWYVCQNGRKAALTFCMGSFQDALWLRWNSPRQERRELVNDSPLRCVFVLAFLAAVSIFFAFRLPDARAMILPFLYRDAPDLAMLTVEGHYAMQLPAVTMTEYRSLTTRAQHLFTRLAYYLPIRTRIATARSGATELSVAFASSNLFELLGEPTFPSGARKHTAILILTQNTWREYFDSDPHIIGRVLAIAGQRAVVAGVIPTDSWRLPGQMDAWLLLHEQDIAALPPNAKGFVLAQVRPSPRLRWRMSLLNQEGGYDRFECVSLARRPLVLAHLLGIGLALLILPVTTSLALGEYPANRHSPDRATRCRRWIFLLVKIALVMPIAFFGVLDLASITAMQIAPHGWLVGYVFGLRWVLTDQRKRCPVCLRLLTNPTSIGWSSQTFLEWYGAELICLNGHGLLYVPEIPTSYGVQRWLYLDASWSGLFSKA